MTLKWKNIQKADDAFTGDVTGTVNGTAASTVKSGAADGVNAKSAVDGNAAITMVGGSIAVPSTVDKQFEVDTNGNAN